MNIKLCFQLPGSLSQSPLPAQEIYFEILAIRPTASEAIPPAGIMPLLIKLIFIPSSDFSFYSLLLTIHPAFAIILQNYPTKKKVSLSI